MEPGSTPVKDLLPTMADNSALYPSTETSSNKENSSDGDLRQTVLPSRTALPEKERWKYWRFRYLTFSIYRRIFAIVYIVNLAILIALVIRASGVPSQFAVNTASSANLMVAILGRQENVVNFLYDTAVKVPHSFPLWFRRRVARVFHYGGIHSGCGAGATVWFLLQTVLITTSFSSNHSTLAVVDLVTSWALVVLLIMIMGSAYPTIRRKFHNHFEILHRFSGWTALAIFWAHLFIVALEAEALSPRGLGKRLVTTPSFWFLVVSTASGGLSWARIRRRDVIAEHLSGHAIRLHFTYYDMPPSYGVKVSDDPLLEWHSFATIPDPEGGFSVLVSNAGDWTNKIINNPPKHLWVRGYPIRGMSYTSKIFKRIVVVATGSGIGPILSILVAKATPCRILWSTPNPLKTYGQKIIDSVLDSDPNAIIWNTREHGRPDLIPITCQLVEDFDAEAVYVVSNKPVTQKIVLEMSVRNIPAYGVLFDS